MADDQPVREIVAVLDLSSVHSERAPYYPQFGRASIDPVLMIRMLIVGYVFCDLIGVFAKNQTLDTPGAGG